jgi:hypothetical protein
MRSPVSLVREDETVFWRLGVSKLLGVEIYNPELHVVLHFDFAQIMQERLPKTVLCKIVRHAFRHENMSRITAIHHALGNVNSRCAHPCADEGEGELSMLY